MTQYELYTWSLIDIANRWCGKIIVVGCDGNHYYEDPCEILNSCTLSIPPVDWCDMVIQIPWWNIAGNILAINSTGTCVERVPALQDQDQRVRTTISDPYSWFLDEKFVVCGNGNLSKSIITHPILGQQVQLCISNPTDMSLLELNDVPNTYGWLCWFTAPINLPNYGQYQKNVRVNATSNGLDFVCPQVIPMAWLRLATDFVGTLPQNTTQSYVISWFITEFATIPSMISTANRIIAPIDWLYEIKLWWNSIWNKSVRSLRSVIISNNTSVNRAIDQDFWTMLVNPTSANNANRATFGWWQPTNMWEVPYQGSCVVYMNAWDWISFAIRADTTIDASIVQRYWSWEFRIYSRDWTWLWDWWAYLQLLYKPQIMYLP